MIVLVDDEHRENEGDLIIPCGKATPEAINFMMGNALRHRLLVHVRSHVPTLASGADGDSCSNRSRPFTQSIDARTGITTGTSAFDRARTVASHRRQFWAGDLMRGKKHVFGLRPEGGVLVRATRKEALTWLACRLRKGRDL